jgi:hypothetical protein
MHSPPVCSTCMEWFTFARLWKILFELEGKAKGATKREIERIRKWYPSMAASRLACLRKTIPTLRKICQINRAFDRYKATAEAPKGRRGK